MNESVMNNCILCGKKTSGSVGKAGIKWTKICQDCKDNEDNALESRLDNIKEAIKLCFM